MKKQFFSGVLAALLLFSGCTAPVDSPAPTETQIPETTQATTPAPTAPAESEPTEPPVLTLRPNHLASIKMNGSTACLPLMAQVLSETAEIPLSEAESIVQADRTADSWMKLINREADLLLVYEMPEEIEEYWNNIPSKVALEMTPIGRDALVFMVNDQNPLQSLTQQQLIEIYTGQVANWSELGGADASIIPFQRNSTSGSQTLFR